MTRGALRFIIISGLSGSGKSYAIKCFEDLGFFCVDNLPVPLLPTFANLCATAQGEIQKVVLGIDIREREFLVEFFTLTDRLKAEGHRVELLFLEADCPTLVKRFSETRRPHPAAKDRPLPEAIQLEQGHLAELRRRADRIIDTTGLTIHQLKAVLVSQYLDQAEPRRLTITLISFGYKSGVPYEADLVFDVRFLPNPNFHPALKALSGDDPRIRAFLLEAPEAHQFMEHLSTFLGFLLPRYEQEGRAYLTIGIGCTGGRHRSVAVAAWLRDLLEKKGYEATVRQRRDEG